MENVRLLRQGGIQRRIGSRFVREVKNSAKDTILLPFEFSVNDAAIMEAGEFYFRFFKNKAPILTSAGGPAVEVVTGYEEGDLRSIHFTQSADVLFFFHADYQQERLSRISDTNWALSSTIYTPPPSFEDDTDISAGASLGVAALTGTGKKVRAASAVFLAGDIGRIIVVGASRAVITAVDDTSQVTVDILDAFTHSITAGPNTGTAAGTNFQSTAHGLAVGNYITFTSGAQSGQIRRVTVIVDPDNVTIDAAFPASASAQSWSKVVAIATGAWLMRLSPQATLDANIKEPINAQVTLVAGLASFRSVDVGKFIRMYGGLVKITTFDSAVQVKGEILAVLVDAADANPAVLPAGAWTLEVTSWDVTQGFPRTGEFFQGRLYQASTEGQPTTVWGSVADDFDSYAVGASAENAVEYTVASRQVNQIEWLGDNIDLFLGTSGSEHRMRAGQSDAAIGGDVIPLVERVSTEGCAGIQPVVISRHTLFIDRSRLRVLMMAFDLNQDGFSPVELTVAAEHIAGTGFRLGHIAYQRRPDKRLHMIREDGQLVTLTFLPQEKVVGFTRYTTDGTFESVAVIPQAAGKPDQIWVIVKRTINGATKRYVEVLDEDHESLASRGWKSLQTDCAKVYSGSATATITGLSHLEGKTVDVVADGGYRGTKVVSGGAITLDDAYSVVEVGLHYDSTAQSMRPALEGQVLEGIPRSWDKVFVRMNKTRGGKLNGQDLIYDPSAIGADGLFEGDLPVTTQAWDSDGRITITQNQPYPMTVLAMFGTLSLGDTD